MPNNHSALSDGDSKRISNVFILAFTRQLFTNTRFPYVSIKVIPSHTRVNRKPINGLIGSKDIG